MPADPSFSAKPGLPQAGPLEQHYSVNQIAKLWSVSDDTVRRLFENEPGVKKFGRERGLVGGRRKAYRRRWLMLRVPQSVLERVEQRLMHKRRPDSAGLPAVLGHDLHAS
jgi:hypothetical protein